MPGIFLTLHGLHEVFAMANSGLIKDSLYSRLTCLSLLVHAQSQGPTTSRMVDSEPGAALVLTVESTEISACSSGSLISKGKFKGQSRAFFEDEC